MAGVFVNRLGRLVADLLTLAQLEAGSLHLACEPQSAEAMLSDVARIMHSLAERAEVTLKVELPDGDMELVADRDRIVQVLLGFVDNALKHSSSGGTVTLRATPHGDSVTLALDLKPATVVGTYRVRRQFSVVHGATGETTYRRSNNFAVTR